MATPTAFEQEMLELINRARLDPAGEFAAIWSDPETNTAYDARVTNALRFFGVDPAAVLSQLQAYDPAAPIAWNEALAAAAFGHSQDMIAYDIQSHNISGEPDLRGRINAAGYDDWRSIGENIYAYTRSPVHGHAGFYVDWGYDDEDISGGSLVSGWQSIGDGIQDPPGHRDSILNNTFTEVGIAAIAENDSSTNVGPYVVTQNFGTRRGVEDLVLGVVFEDTNADGHYTAGEGTAGVTMTLGSGASTQTWTSGGYQIAADAPNGATELTVSGLSGLAAPQTVTLTMQGENAKADFQKTGAHWTLESSVSVLQQDSDSPLRVALLGLSDLSLTGARHGTGNAGNNVITGTDTDGATGDPGDTLMGGVGHDTILGLGGNDSIVGGNGADSLSGGANYDTILAGAGWDTVEGGNGRDLIRLNGGNDLFIDNAQGGENGQDTVFAGLGNDTIEGGNGNDVFYGEDGDDVIRARLGNDTAYGGNGADTVEGGDGRDLVFLNLGHDRFIDTDQGGPEGQDTVWAGYGNDTIEGGNGNDRFLGEDGNDVINGRLGNDEIFGGTGFDTIRAGEGNDSVTGGDGRDLVFLNQGNDLFNDNAQGGELGRDTVFAGLGDDTVEGGNGDDIFYGEAGNDVIRARLGNDSVYGGDNFDFLDAGDGDDLVFGGNGQDTVLLGAGNDRYVDTDQGGPLGNDTITGGQGADTFVFGTVLAADVITDFQVGIDTLQIASAQVGGRTAAQVVADFASTTDQGVLLDFGGGESILLSGLTTAGLAGSIDIA